MLKHRTGGLVAVTGLAVALFVALGWNQSSPAQLMAAGKGGYADFEPLITKHGDKGMLLEVHVLTGSKGEILGKVAQATNEFLVLKAQNGQDLYFVTWDDVVWITARPN